jgi:hypothetical protein
MDYIPDKALFAAVMFARKMMREGTPPGIANTRAANYYAVSVQDVAHYIGQVGGRDGQDPGRPGCRSCVAPRPSRPPKWE